MADQWYFARDGMRFGPYSAAQLRQLAASRQIHLQDTVWKAGSARSAVAAKVKGLFPGTPVMAPPVLPHSERLAPQPPRLADEGASWTPAPSTARPRRTDPGHPEVPLQPSDAPRRVLRVTGGVLLSQDGMVLRYRKQCLKCGYVDTRQTAMRIPGGMVSLSFFCPKCKQTQRVEIQGVS
jgi:hypothetical protein